MSHTVKTVNNVNYGTGFAASYHSDLKNLNDHDLDKWHTKNLMFNCNKRGCETSSQ